MGYYLETGTAHNKAAIIEQTHGATRITPEEAEFFIAEQDGAVICVVNNGMFEAAAFCYNLDEFRTFSDPRDDRPKTWLVIPDREKVERLTNFRQSDMGGTRR